MKFGLITYTNIQIYKRTNLQINIVGLYRYGTGTVQCTVYLWLYAFPYGTVDSLRSTRISTKALIGRTRMDTLAFAIESTVQYSTVQTVHEIPQQKCCGLSSMHRVCVIHTIPYHTAKSIELHTIPYNTVPQATMNIFSVLDNQKSNNWGGILVEQGLCLSAGEMSRILPNLAVYIPDMTGNSCNKAEYLRVFEFEFRYSAILLECTSIRCVFPPNTKHLYCTLLLNCNTIHEFTYTLCVYIYAYPFQ